VLAAWHFRQLDADEGDIGRVSLSHFLCSVKRNFFGQLKAGSTEGCATVSAFHQLFDPSVVQHADGSR
jgi:hypothetical protein